MTIKRAYRAKLYTPLTWKFDNAFNVTTINTQYLDSITINCEFRTTTTISTGHFYETKLITQIKYARELKRFKMAIKNYAEPLLSKFQHISRINAEQIDVSTAPHL